MGTSYTVQSGDSLSAIARQHGLASWRDIYFYEENANFRRKRPDPNRIYPGDELIIPTEPSKGRLGDTSRFRLLDVDLRLRADLDPDLLLPPRIPLRPLGVPGPPIWGPSIDPFPLGPRFGPAWPVGRPFCAVPARSSPPWAVPTQPRPGSLGDVASAVMKCPEVKQWLQRVGDETYDVLWGDAPGWRRGLTVGVAIAGATGLLIMSETRDPFLNMLPTLPVGRLVPSSFFLADQVRPLSLEIKWEEQSRGFMLHYDVRQLIR
jgi:hypothetical protein